MSETIWEIISNLPLSQRLRQRLQFQRFHIFPKILQFYTRLFFRPLTEMIKDERCYRK